MSNDCGDLGNGQAKPFNAQSIPTLVKKIPGNQPAQQQPPPRQQTTVSLSAQLVSGPLPSPEILLQYNHILPDAAERIFAMAERDSTHLQSMEKMHLSAIFLERRLGQILGFSIAILALGASVFLAFNGREITASVIGGTTLVSLVSVFVVGRLSRNSKPVK